MFALWLCCFGMGYNRLKVRVASKIKGSYCTDCLVHALPICCLAVDQEIQQASKTSINRKSKSTTSFIIRGSRFEKTLEMSICSMEEGPRFTLPNFRMTHKDSKMIGPFLSQKNKGKHIDKPKAPLGSTYDRTSSDFKDKIKPFEVAIEPIDGNSFAVYSMTVGTPPFSFALGLPFDAYAPPPTYIPLVDIQQARPNERGLVLIGLDRLDSGFLKSFDSQAVALQQKAANEFLISCAKASPIVRSSNITMDMYEPRTTLQRLSDRFSFAPVMLAQAAKKFDPVERLVDVIGFAVGGLYPLTQQVLPLNSMLGETYQGVYNKDTSIYFEQVSSAPSTARFLVQGKGFSCDGFTIIETDYKKGSLMITLKGPTFVRFTDGQIISFEIPSFYIDGIERGERLIRCCGAFTVKDKANCLTAELRVGIDWEECNVREIAIKHDTLLGKLSKKSGADEEVLLTFDGSWLEKLFVVKKEDVEILWDSYNCLPCFPTAISQPLPSDSRYREDLIWLTRDRIDFATAWREKLENRQKQNSRMRQVNKAQRLVPSRSRCLKQLAG